MNRVRPAAWLLALLAAAWLAAAPRPARAQVEFGLGQYLPNVNFQLPENVELDRADSAVRTALERVQAYADEKQWDEAVQTLREVMENSGDKLIEVSPHRYINVRQYGHLQLVRLGPDALRLYRSRVDALAGKWYEEGVAQRRADLLRSVVQQAYASSWCDDALMALGEIALERGDYAEARYDWEQIIPAPDEADPGHTWLRYPDTRLELAAVRARLVTASILEGSLARAADELDTFAALHPDARGQFGGREVNYVEALREMLSAAADWPPRPSSPDWRTFAGRRERNKVVTQSLDVGPAAWRVELGKAPSAGRLARSPDVAGAAATEDPAAPLSYHPVVAGGLVLVNNQTEIRGFEAATRKPAWGTGVLFRDLLDPVAQQAYNPPDMLGLPRFTLTVHGGRLYARMGSAVTARPQQSTYTAAAGYLVCLDLEAEGRLVWKKSPEEEPWSFEGTPVADGADVYVAMRRSNVGPQYQAHVACLDAETGALRWRTFVCAAETRTRGALHEASHNLLTLAGDTIYYNTNLGAVAAISAHDGSVRWLSLYPRQREGSLLKPAAHWSRDLTPCLMDHGTLLVAPADSPKIFALDAATGHFLWSTGEEVSDVVHLLGTAGNQLIASGKRIYWIATDGPKRGRVQHVFPDGADSLGYGRGVLAGGRVYWPTREVIYVFDQATARQLKTIQLKPLGLTGGNLVPAGGQLFMATSDALVALTNTASPKPTGGDVAVVGWDKRSAGPPHDSQPPSPPAPLRAPCAAWSAGEGSLTPTREFTDARRRRPGR